MNVRELISRLIWKELDEEISVRIVVLDDNGLQDDEITVPISFVMSSRNSISCRVRASDVRAAMDDQHR